MASSDFLKGYELANDSIRRFWSERPHGRLKTSIVESLTNLEKGYVTFKAEVWVGTFHDDSCAYCKDVVEQIEPSATGYAYGNVATYLASMKRFYVEDTETSALARAIKTLSPSTMRPSVEEMNRVDYLTVVPEMPRGEVEIQVSEERDPWTISQDLTIKPPKDLTAPLCSHGFMEWLEGTSKSTGRPYNGWVCTSKNESDKCKAIWLKVTQ